LAYTPPIYRKELKITGGVTLGELYCGESKNHSRWCTLGISDPEPISSAVRTVHDDSSLLEDAIQHMVDIGINPHDLLFIQVRILEPEVIERLAVAASHSNECKQVTARNFHKGVADLIMRTGVYNDFNIVLQKYRLHIDRVGVEKVDCEKLSKLKGYRLKKGEADVRVPVDALLDLVLSPTQEN
jgi:hypothetical protein